MYIVFIAYKLIWIVSQQKQLLRVLKRPYSMKWFFWTPKKYVVGTQKNRLSQWVNKTVLLST